MDVIRQEETEPLMVHFGNLPECSPPPATAADDAAGATPTAAPTTGSSGAPPLASAGVSSLSVWHILVPPAAFAGPCEARVFSPTPSLASALARGVQRDGSPAVAKTVDGVPIVPVHQRDVACAAAVDLWPAPEEDGGYAHCRLRLTLARLEPAVLGLPASSGDLRDVVIVCDGNRAGGAVCGTAEVQCGGEALRLPLPLRFLIRPFRGSRCTHCLDPVHAPGFTCAACEVPQYCSRDCMVAHTRRTHGLLCPLLQEAFRNPYRCGAAAASTGGPGGGALVAWWRCLPEAQYQILVDARPGTEWGLELTLRTLPTLPSAAAAEEEAAPSGAGSSGGDASDDLRFRFILPKSSTTAGGASAAAASPPPAAPSAPGPAPPGASPSLAPGELHGLVCTVLLHVCRSATVAGCAALASACLHQLFRLSPARETVMAPHTLFISAFDCQDFDVPKTSVEEYATFARPLHDLALLTLEHALTSAVSMQFWRRLRTAKELLMVLLSVNTDDGGAGGGGAASVLGRVILRQQCRALALLARVFVVMATRGPPEEAPRWLEQAEKCYQQSLETELVRTDAAEQARVCARLAALQLLYRPPRREANKQWQDKVAALAALGAQQQQQQQQQHLRDRQRAAAAADKAAINNNNTAAREEAAATVQAAKK